MANKNALLIIASFSILILLFWLKGVLFLDPDLFWHIKMGQIIAADGIPHTDPFTFSMPSYFYANHEWLSEIILAKLYGLTGIAGLSFLFSIFTTLTIYVFFRKNCGFFLLPLFLFSCSLLLPFSGIRLQTIGWFLFALILILEKSSISKLLIFYPLIFLFWANLHGSFVIGLVLIFLFFLKKRFAFGKFDINYFLLFLLSCLVTLLNPFGIKLWIETWHTISDPFLRWVINEWLPLFFDTGSLFLWIWIVISSFLFLKYSRISFVVKVFYLLFLFLGISSSRNFPFYLIFTIPAVIGFLQNPKLIKKKSSLIITILFLSLFLGQVFFTFNEKSLEQAKNPYPKKAAEFLQSKKPGDRIFASYGFGGYLISQLPQNKFFIYGAMPSWRQKIKPDESDYAFKEYLEQTLTNTDLNLFFNKYNISTVVWGLDDSTSSKKGNPLSPFALKLKRFDLSEKTFLQRIESIGWEKIYQDNISVIYQKVK